MNLALFPITALLLLLSGVGSPAHLADGRQSATALIKAILASNPSGLPQKPAMAGQRLRHQPPAAAPGSRAANRATTLPVALEPVGSQGTASRKPYRTRFGGIAGAYQPQGPPKRTVRALLG